MLTYSELKEMADWFFEQMMDWWETGAEVNRDQMSYEFTWEWRTDLDEIEIKVDWFETMFTMVNDKMTEIDQARIAEDWADDGPVTDYL